MLKNYFKTALRNIGRNKIYATINVLGLSLGLACAMLIMLYIKDEVSFDRFHANVDNIYVVGRTVKRPNGDILRGGSTGLFQGPRFAAAIPEIKSAVRYERTYRDAKHGTDIQSEKVYRADKNFFSVFSFPLVHGNAATALQDPNSVVITEDVAKKEFGTTDAVGRLLYFKKDDDFAPYKVSAVAKNCPQNSSIRFEILLPFTTTTADENRNENWFNSWLKTFVVLTPDANITAVEAKMKRVFESDAAPAIATIKEKYGVKDVGIAHFLQTFTSVHLDAGQGDDPNLNGMSNPVYSYILSGVAIFILLIACINFVNISMAQSLKRAKEIGIRKVIGADRKKIIVQFLGESFLLCFAAFGLAVVIAQIALPLFNNIANKALAFNYLLDAKLIAGYLALFTCTFLLAGFYPALVLSKYNPVATLYSRLKMGGKNVLQKTLVVVQFSLASFLIIATVVIFLQFNFLTNQPLGYDDTNLVTVDIGQMSNNDVQLVRAQLQKSPGILSVAAKNGGQWNTTVKTSDDKNVTFAYETIDEAYLPLLKISVVSGRNFSPAFPGDSTHSILVNESFVKEAGWKDAIGQQVSFYEPNQKYTVVGVVKDHHFRPLTEKIGPQMFTMNPANGYGMFLIKIKAADKSASVASIEKVLKGIFPMQPYNLSFREDDNKTLYEAEAKWKQLLLSGAVLTIFIACIGLFGLSVLFAGNRTKEIGIRKVLGASVSSVATALSKDFLKLVVIALLVSIPFAWIAVSKWLENYPYRISLNVWVFAGAGLLVVLVALVTVSFQSIKAAMANPVKAIKAE
jgi:putative ABC transport system permease protein